MLIKFNSFTTKVFLSFFLLGFFLLLILFLQIIPELQEREKKQAIKQIENMLDLINQQLIQASISIKNSGQARREELKSIMELETKKIYKSINNKENFLNLKTSDDLFDSKKISCNISILDKNKNIIFQKDEESFENIKDKLLINDFLRIDEKTKYVCPTGYRRLFYTKEIEISNNYIVLSCDIDEFKATNLGFEEKLKEDIQKSFSQLEEFHKGKIYLMWLNLTNVQNNTPLYEKNDDYFYNEKYCLSRISNFKFPMTGTLTGNDILQAADKNPIKHQLNNQSTLTWIKTIDKNDTEGFLFVTSIHEKDFYQNIDSTFIKILPAAFFSFFISIFLALFLFKRLFKGINQLTNIAIKINEGNTNLRSNIKGNDDIAILAKAFDNMLNTLEDNIIQLDNKIEEKTKELSKSLKEKETLLKEIHHRVKNNLAITISLIKLEKAKISNQDTKNSLINIQEKVYAMELLHRKLYESENLSSIHFETYIKELINELCKSYLQDNSIKITSQIDDMNLTLDYALPCGLIISELITNSFKYAFIKEKREKEIVVIAKMEKTICYLTVWDNGIGLNNSININNTKSLGLQIISNIVKGQLFGTFKYTYESGSKFEIIFDLEKNDL